MITLRTRVLLAAAALLAAGCAQQQHLTRGFGSSYDAAFAAQRAARAAPAQAVTGLDPQEASVIADGYRGSLAPAGTAVQPEPMILLAPNQRDGVAKPAPSVPKR